MILKLSKEEIKRLIDKGTSVVRYDNKWRYWNPGDDYKTCPLLEAVHHIEKNGGYIIFIPDNKKEFKPIAPLSKEDLFGRTK